MHGAALANESRAKLPEDSVDTGENLPETMSVLAVVSVVVLVQSEANGARNFDGHGPDFYVDAEGMKRGHKFGIEFGDGARHERERADFAAAGGDVEEVGDEIESDFETAAVIGDCGGG